MKLKDCYDRIKNDKSSGSDLFVNLRESVKNLYIMKSFFENHSGELEDEERNSLYRRYILAYWEAKRAAESYRNARDGRIHTDVGKKRMAFCKDTLEAINDECDPPDYTDTGIEISEDLDEFQKIAAIAEKEGEIAAEKAAKSIGRKKGTSVFESDREFVEQHKRLHTLLVPDDDESFIRHYAENRTLLAKIIAIGNRWDDEKMKRRAVNAEIYERYFVNRMKLLKLPKTEAYREEREDAEHELKLCKEAGVRTNYKPKEKEKKISFIEDIGSDGAMTARMLEGKASFAHPTKFTVSSSGKFRVGKIGAKLTSKYFQASSSASIGKVNGSLDFSPKTLNGINDINSLNMGASGFAGAYGAKLRGKVTLGTKSTHVGLKAQVIFGNANAYAKGDFLSVSAEDEDDPSKTHQEAGVEAAAGALASPVSLVYGGEVSILGIKFTLTNMVHIGGVNADAQAHFSTGRLSFSLGFALGLGGTVMLSIDWTRAKEKFMRFFRSRRRVSQEMDEKKLRQNLGSGGIEEEDVPAEIPAQNAESLSEDSIDERIDDVQKAMEGSSGTYRRVLKTAKAQLKEMQHELLSEPKSKEFRSAADHAMAALVLAEIIQKQRVDKVSSKQRIENAIHDRKQMEEVLNRIVAANKGNRLWNAEAPDTLLASMQGNAVCTMADKVLRASRRREKPADKAIVNTERTFQL